MEQTSYQSQDLIYEEPGYSLVVYLEFSGLRQFDFVGAAQDFDTWTTPAGEPIPEQKRQQILDRLAAWSRGQRVRINIGPAVDLDAMDAEFERKGGTIVRHVDGSKMYIPPKHVPPLRRFWQWLAGKRE